MEAKTTLSNHTCNRDTLPLRSVATTSSDFALQWGNRKKVRCMKVHQPKNSKSPSNSIIDEDRTGIVAVQRSTTRIDRRVVRSDLNNNKSKDPIPNHKHDNNNVGTATATGNGYLNLRRRPDSPPPRRILRNTGSSISGMKGHSNGVRGLISPDRGDKNGTSTSNNNNNRYNKNCSNSNHYNEHRGRAGGSSSPEAACDGKRDGYNEKAAALWLPNFVITLTNKEKEEDFLAIKGCKLPQRPKKRAKVIQRSLNLVCPGAWLCGLTLERYEVREKRVPKKRPRGLKAMMGNMDSDSE